MTGIISGATSSKGKLYGVGVGPGDPELMTLKAARLIGTAPVVAYFRKKGRMGHARTIIEGRMAPGVIEIAMDYPLTTEVHFEDPAYNAALSPFYADCVTILAAYLEQGQDVVVVAEGDPFFYGSFMHIYTRLSSLYQTEVVPGVTGMAGGWTTARQPITWGDDILTVMPGTLSEEALEKQARNADALVIMKVGKHLPKLRRALERAGRLEAAFYVERATMAKSRVLRLKDFEGEAAPYFSVVLVPGEGRRP